jgi:hypothetical protein
MGSMALKVPPVRFWYDMTEQADLGGSSAGSRSVGNCCGFKRGEWILYDLQIKAGMFRNGHKSGLGGMTAQLPLCNFFPYYVIKGVIILTAQPQTSIT